MGKKVVTVEQLLENARQAEKLTMQMALAAEASIERKQDTLTGTQGQVVGFDANGNPVPQAATTFNGRKGAIMPKAGDYTATDVGAVPTTRKVNGKALSADITLAASDVGARPNTWTPTAADVGARPNTWTPTAADVGAVPKTQTIDGVSLNGSAAITHYGTCDTAAATAAKVVTLAGFSLVTGAKVAVKFAVTNTAANPTLNVNSTGAKAIYYRGAAITAGYLAANRTYEFVYNGTQYELVGDVNTNTTYAAAGAAPLAAGTAAVGTSAKYAREDHVHPAQTSVSGNAGTATKLKTERKIGNANFDGSKDITLAGIGAVAAGGVAAIQVLTQSEYNALGTKSATTLYLIKE